MVSFKELTHISVNTPSQFMESMEKKEITRSKELGFGEVLMFQNIWYLINILSLPLRKITLHLNTTPSINLIFQMMHKNRFGLNIGLTKLKMNLRSKV
jgi:hypothetical protein